MRPNGLSPAIIVADTEPARHFYATHFNARITFDCGWYLNMELGKGGPSLQFMEPQSKTQPLYEGGLTYNIRLETTEEVDAAFAALDAKELTMVMPLEDHPWGDRGFCTLDPYGVGLYVYADIEPSDEFKQYHKG